MEEFDLKTLLQTVADWDASDLHLKVGSPPVLRVDGVMHKLDGPKLSGEDTQAIVRMIVPERQRERLESQEVDFAFSAPGVGRFRVNVFSQRGSVSLVFRRMRVGSASFDDLGLPPVLRELCDTPRGLILVTGPTGSGKTTTLAAMVDQINATKAVHILTLEDPIEVLHPDRMATVNQREVGVDTQNFVGALRAAMRQDPDVILIGEMRDAETVSAALSAAETGHLVMSTLHTNDAVETINRVVDFFPPYQQNQVRVTLASVLRGVVCQRLVVRQGGGRVPALEVMVMNGRIAERIVDPSRTSEINDIIAQGDFYGMRTFDQALVDLVSEELVTIDDAMEAASRPHDFQLMLQQRGIAVPG